MGFFSPPDTIFQDFLFKKLLPVMALVPEILAVQDGLNLEQFIFKKVF